MQLGCSPAIMDDESHETVAGSAVYPTHLMQSGEAQQAFDFRRGLHYQHETVASEHPTRKELQV